MTKETQISSGLLLASDSPDGKWAGVVEDDGSTGYFYLYRHDKGIQDSILLYHSAAVPLSESDIQVYWSRDSRKCGVAVRGKYRAIIDVVSRQKLSRFMESIQTAGIRDKGWLLGLPEAKEDS
jgi:hypothetical protein